MYFIQLWIYVALSIQIIQQLIGKAWKFRKLSIGYTMASSLYYECIPKATII
jgi:hypothetical protein